LLFKKVNRTAVITFFTQFEGNTGNTRDGKPEWKVVGKYNILNQTTLAKSDDVLP